MLRHLHIKNLALIDDLEVSFDTGFNVITGETGAGKSLLMQALGLVLGSRGAADLIRHEAQEASVEAVFTIDDTRIAQLLEDSGYPADDEFLVRRIIAQNGRGRVYLNGAIATVAILRQFGERLMHVYGQHEQHALLEADAALGLLDTFADHALQLREMDTRYQTLRQLWTRLQSLTQDKSAAQARRELLHFQADEIKRAELRAGEEEGLRQEKLILQNAEKISQAVLAGEELLVSGDEAITDRLGRLLTRLRELARIDTGLEEIVTLLSSSAAQVEEAAHSLHKYGARLRPNPERLEEVDTRLTQLSRLKQKYGGSIEATLAFYETIIQELHQLDGGEEALSALHRDIDSATTAAWTCAQELSRHRRAAAQMLETNMKKELAKLGMKGATFSVSFLDDAGETDNIGTPFIHGAQRLSSTGCDRAEFYLSANIGEPLRPLAHVASGGELSRLMLALKALSAAAGEAPTLIFDEVDAGIGGAVAEVVGRRLKSLAKQRQVLCITHLPQIAAFADHAYTVVKTTSRGRTTSSTKKLTQNEHLQELARMLGGVEISAEARRHAKEMLEGARRGNA